MILCPISPLLAKSTREKEKKNIRLWNFIANFAPKTIKRMKKIVVLGLLAIVSASCSEKKESRDASPVKVKVMAVGTESVSGSQHYSGTIEEESGTSLSFAGLGTVERLAVSEGQFVQKGQLIGVLDATSAKNAYDAALAAKEQALDAQARMQQLHDAGSLPEIKWIEVQTQVRQALASEQIAKKGLTDTKLLAPFSGYIAQKSVEAGANVAPGVPVVRLVRIDHVKVRISVPEEEIAQVQKGQNLVVFVSAYNDRAFEATVTEKGVSADPLSRSYEVKGLIPNPRHELLPGMIAEVMISKAVNGQSSIANEKIALPADVIQIDANNIPFVWVVRGGKAERAFLVLGENVGASVAIADGLERGDSVIIEGQQKVSTGIPVVEVP